MIRYKMLVTAGLLLVAATVAACSGRPVTPPAATPPPSAGSLITPSASDEARLPAPTDQPAEAEAQPATDLARTDTQGAVEFVVTPLNLNTAGATLDFDVSMNTHSVDLAWDLAAQSVLATDTGREVAGQSWPAGTGHHYEGTLTFPVTAANGEGLLDSATTLTLTIRNTDVPARVFTWALNP